jgi:hypothetical protein
MSFSKKKKFNDFDSLGELKFIEISSIEPNFNKGVFIKLADKKVI